ncbi:hypothetical protein GCM10010466_39700 [Planomonospora alba]|uniref:Uncharacterized protein n=1 Tax=Planomonospora alba TaxID=161354 RepID=A0ABP6NEI7_9ACTN
MVWFRVDDGLHGHPKVVMLSLDALGLWTRAGSWASFYLTDGFVPEEIVREFAKRKWKRLSDELVERKLWLRVDKGFVFHDFGEYNPLAKDVLAEREAAQKRMRELRARRRNRELLPAGTPDPEGETGINVRPNTSGTFAERSPDVRNPVPSRPDPTPIKSSSHSPTSPYGPRRGQDDDRDQQGDDDLAGLVTRLLTPHTRTPITADHADRVVRDILTRGRNVKYRARYIRRVLEDNPARFLPTPAPAAAASGDRCPRHPYQAATTCTSCAGDRKARPDA